MLSNRAVQYGQKCNHEFDSCNFNYNLENNIFLHILVLLMTFAGTISLHK